MWAMKGGGGEEHRKNDDACNTRGWSCIPLLVETYGGWGHEAFARLSKLANC